MKILKTSFSLFFFLSLFFFFVVTNVSLFCITTQEVQLPAKQVILGITMMDYSWHFGHSSQHEKLANYAVLLPDSVWSLISIEDLFANYMLFVLFLPLIYCFFILVYLLWNQIRYLYFGKQTLYESKELNFSKLTSNYWRVLWSYAYDMSPRYDSLRVPYEDYKVKNKFPSPSFAYCLIDWVFVLQDRITYLIWFTYFFLTCWAFMINDFTFLAFLLVCYVYSYYWTERSLNSRWTLGHNYNRKNIYKFWKWMFLREDFFEYLHLRSRLAIYPLFFSFFLFISATGLLFYVYYYFIFHPIVTWNGYFSNTVIALNFPSSISMIIFNKKVVLIEVPFSFDYFLALDGLNVWLVWLTSLLVYLSALYLLDTIKLYSFISQLGWIFLLAFASFQFFCVPSYLWMYIFFELSLLPIFILIVFWGSNWRKIHAAYQMVLFTFIGSMFLLAAVFLIFSKIHSFNTFDIFALTQGDTNNILFTMFEKKLIWLFLFIGFAVKTPLYPFHIWLPEAHSEAPTTGSVMLAGVLLKMGTYGFLRFVIPLFPCVLETFKTLVFSMCLCGIILSSLAALAQVDVKKIIAYSSIGHMGLVILGIYTMDENGFLGASYMMLSHGLVSSAMFFSIGLLYKIYGTRSIIYYSSIAHFMPWFSMAFFIFSLANMSFPGTAGFPGEILIFASLMCDNFFLAVLVGVGSVFGGVYSIWLLTRVLYGQISPKISAYRDLKPAEWKIVNFLVILIILFGIFPFFVLDIIKPMCNFYMVLKNF